MGLWDEDIQFYIEDENQYLEDPDKGLELISKLLSYDKRNKNKHKTIKKLDNILDKKLLEGSGNINISNELVLYDKLITLSDKLYEQNKIRLLKNKSVIGIGGKFSAGKSKFINSLLEEDILPEDQTPTTSIATYIVRDKDEDVRAYTYDDKDISLDMEAVQALTHHFYNKYGLGFSQFINNLVINIPYYPYRNVALLDTPGYSKWDSGIKRNITDSQKAYNQLRTVDYLIWLVDIENGVVHQSDINFIKSLNIKNPILIIFNKADKKTEESIEKILLSSRDVLKNTGINIYDVIAYSSLEREEYLGGNKLLSYLKQANESINHTNDIENQINDIIETITKELDSQREKMIIQRNKIGDIIFKSDEIMEIQTLVKLYTEMINKILEINNCRREFDKTRRKISDLLIYINKE